MRTKQGKRKPAPAIVPRFLKGAVTIGAIPAIAAACGKPQNRMQPVVAYMAAPAPPEEASITPNPPPNPPVVAAYQREVQPVVAAYAMDAQPIAPPLDAGVDAAPAKKAKPDKTKSDKLKRPPPPVVAALLPGDKR
ncbi:MAG TPA: hypothetical protein VIV58_26055 [Kofleriaceae bacterium]